VRRFGRSYHVVVVLPHRGYTSKEERKGASSCQQQLID
ncbi:unnamed protein product, partial [Ectocarpus sp. 13 AM-2016]